MQTKKNKVGRPRTLEAPKDLLKLFNDYVEEVKSKPDTWERVTPKGLIIERVSKPLTKQGLYAYAFRQLGRNINHYFENSGGRYLDFCEVAMYIRSCIEDDQISGTLTGKYKAQTLVARLNGYADHVQNLNHYQPPRQLSPLDFFDKEDGSRGLDVPAHITRLTFFETPKEAKDGDQ